jgi:hypothetical protein
MPLSKFFTLEKCTFRTGRTIRNIIIVSCFALALLILYSPFEYFFRYIGYADSNGCPVYTLTGVPCPTCGMGHSLRAIITGDTAHWFYYNPSAPVLYLLGFGSIGFVFVLAFFNYKVKPAPAFYKLWYVAVIAIIVVWALNILFGHH